MTTTASTPRQRISGWSNLQVFMIWGVSCVVCLNLNSYRSVFFNADYYGVFAGTTTMDGTIDTPDVSSPALFSTATTQAESLSDPLTATIQSMLHSFLESDSDFQTQLQSRRRRQEQEEGEEVTEEEGLEGEILQALQRVVEANSDLRCQPPLTDIPPSVNCTTATLPPSPKPGNKQQAPGYRFSPNTKGQYLTGMAQIKREEFLTTIDGGLPLNIVTRSEKKDVFLMYGGKETLPTDTKHHEAITRGLGEPPILSFEEALENCGQLGIIYVRENNYVGECNVIVPGSIEALYVQKWLRSKPGPQEYLDMSQPFQLVERLRPPKGPSYSSYMPENEKSLKINAKQRKYLAEFFVDAEVMMDELRPLVAPIAKDNQLVIFIVNPGQFEFLVNFACHAKGRGLSIAHCVVFVTKPELKAMVEDLGMTAYYNEKYFGVIPSDSGHFGGSTFGKVVALKQIAPFLISAMGYDFLFQDVDVFWIKDPLELFANPKLADPLVDMYFQDDNNHRLEQMPFRGNTGTYYVRNNAKTQKVYFDAIYRSNRLQMKASDQQAMAANLFENAVSEGLRVKTYSAEETEFLPNGFHYHYRRAFVDKMIRGKTDAYMFHMNWASEKTIKVKFLKQLGAWYVKPGCEWSSNSTQASSCCSADPILECFFSNRASLEDCSSSPLLER